MYNKASFHLDWEVDEYGEFPIGFSKNARKIVSEKYFAKGETSLYTMVDRVVGAICEYGYNNKYFADPAECGDFGRELASLLLNQHVSFNSPVWFNLGVEDNPQCSACFIQSVDDSIPGIFSLMAKEGALFKHGSGTGTNFSTLRPKGAPLSNGGVSSGPLEFMKAFDTSAGAIKSGGKTRRSAKMVLLDCGHPDVEEFIWSKVKEERKAKDMVKHGMDPEEAYASVFYQNGNHSVRLTDEFMRHATKMGNKHSDLLSAIAHASWECGDPGVQFTDTINKDNPCPEDFTINASNPCSEFLFCDESACNLASIKLSKHTVANLRVIVETMITAMDIIVDLSGYPSPEIDYNSRYYRPLGLGFTNLGAYLMDKGLHYDSGAARMAAGAIASDMLFYAQGASRMLAEKLGSSWCKEPLPLRNAQLTLTAPTGTISFMMDCDSTGIEPVFAAKQIKKLSSGDTIEICPQCVEDAYRRDGDYSKVATAIGEYAITPKAHIEMMAAVQPFLSGAISKTVNLPAEATVSDIRKLIVDSWGLGLKCVAFYRDGCKGIQPLSEKVPAKAAKWSTSDVMLCTQPPLPPAGYTVPSGYPSGRIKLPPTRNSITHKFSVGGVEGYLTVGLYDDETPGEIFLTVSKQGSTMGGMVDAWATAFSMCLQYGVPLTKLCTKYEGVRFEPSGFTGSEDVHVATSIVDYVAQWLRFMYLQDGEEETTESILYPSGDMCGNCGSMMVQTGSCKACPSCAYSTGGCG